jgi:Pyruvate/2-oxoacid:ferredoxin oxidoreductase delta subunit
VSEESKMAVRNIIEIDEEKCDGCGLCVPSCAEGAIRIVDGKAKLISETYCDGLGACLSECPQDAIRMVQREAHEYDEKAVEKHLKETSDSGRVMIPGPSPRPLHIGGGCPGSAMRSLTPERRAAESAPTGVRSALGHWPVQLMLVPPHAPFLKGTDLLICADCVPFAVPNFHSKYLAGRSLLVGCPKLDDLTYYREKLKAILAEASPRSITVLKMEVPCCTGIAQATLEARDETLPELSVTVETIGIRGGAFTEHVEPQSKAV